MVNVENVINDRAFDEFVKTRRLSVHDVFVSGEASSLPISRLFPLYVRCIDQLLNAAIFPEIPSTMFSQKNNDGNVAIQTFNNLITEHLRRYNSADIFMNAIEKMDSVYATQPRDIVQINALTDLANTYATRNNGQWLYDPVSGEFRTGNYQEVLGIQQIIEHMSVTISSGLQLDEKPDMLAFSAQEITINQHADFEAIVAKNHIILHELHNITNQLFGYTSLMSECEINDQQISEYADIVSKKILQARDLVTTGKLLLESEKILYSSEKFREDTTTWLQQILERSVSSDGISYQIHTRMDLSGNEQLYLFDALTGFLMEDIGSNAIKAMRARNQSEHMKSHDELHLYIRFGRKVFKEVEYLVCTISDNGCGFDPGILSKGFNRGKTLWSGDTNMGTGIGMHAMSIMLRLLGGSIDIHNRVRRNEVLGAQIKIFLPMQPTKKLYSSS